MKNNKFTETYMSIIKEENECLAKESLIGAIGGGVAGAAVGGPLGAVGGALVGSQLNNEEDEASDTEQLKTVCFKTSDATLIDTLNSGFDEVVFFVKAKDEAGEDTITEVKFKSDSFGPFEIKDDVVDECGDTEVATEEDEEIATEEDEEIATEEDEVATEEEEINPEEWVEDGVCVKCGSADCKGDCKCEKCGSINCIGDCDINK